MADVNKKVLVEKVVAKHEITKKEATEIVDLVFEEIAKAVKGKKVVDIAGFGKFQAKKRKARTGHNPKTNEKIKIAACTVPSFKAAKAFKELVK